MLRVSLIIPLYQGERFIAEAVASALEQEERPAEIIVVDDGSTDGGPAIVRGIPGVLCLGQSNRGPAAARNAGVAAASGDLIAFLDQDDLLRPAALRRHRETLAATPEARLSVCKQRIGLLPGESLPPWQRVEHVGSDVLAWTPSCICCRRQVFQELGRFDEGLKATSDLEWFRAFRARPLPFAEIPETLVDRRVHAGAQSGDAETYRREMLEFARRAALANRSGERR
ncbi:MAG: hypothetical protein RLZZ111_938 [Planctomycetota bacterium]|jgi:glycosyltransferase involved in cell wall biosynthesis